MRRGYRPKRMAHRKPEVNIAGLVCRDTNQWTVGVAEKKRGLRFVDEFKEKETAEKPSTVTFCDGWEEDPSVGLSKHIL